MILIWISIVIFLVGFCITATYQYLSKQNSINTDSVMIFLTVLIFLLTVYTVYLTDYNQKLVFYDIPNFPDDGIEIIPTSMNVYVDSLRGNFLIYEYDYIIKYSKKNPPETYDFLLDLPTEVTGFISVNGNYGSGIASWADAANHSVNIMNEYNANPLLLNIVYASGTRINPMNLVVTTPLPLINNRSVMNDSFFVKVENVGNVDIKNLRLQSNVTNWMDIYLTQLKNETWINQPVMIYENGVPVDEDFIDEEGIISWNVESLDSGKQKIYHFQKIKESSRKR